MKSQWVHNGYFDFSSEEQGNTPSQQIRAALCEGLGLEPQHLSIAAYPVGPNFRHTFWWRRGDSNYAEMQFFMQISHDYPVLSVGVSVEKGYTDNRHGEDRRMDRASWHWPRLLAFARALVKKQIPTASVQLGLPVSIRLNVLKERNRMAEHSRAFSYFENRWSARHVGRASEDMILETLAELDKLDDCWVNAHIAADLSPDQVESYSPAAVADRLLAFAGIWNSVHGLTAPVQAAV